MRAARSFKRQRLISQLDALIRGGGVTEYSMIDRVAIASVHPMYSVGGQGYKELKARAGRANPEKARRRRPDSKEPGQPLSGWPGFILAKGGSR